MAGRERAESPGCLLELALTTGPVVAPGLVPGDDDVDEALEEILLGRVRCAPRVLEGLVRLEVLAGTGEVEPSLEVRRRP